jgi:hypothetical protein
MGVNLHMKIGKHNLNLGRSHNFIDPIQMGRLELDSRNLYDELFSCREDFAKRINAIAAHHPTQEELDSVYETIEQMLTDFISDITRLGRCLTLSEIKEAYDKVKFKVE